MTTPPTPQMAGDASLGGLTPEQFLDQGDPLGGLTPEEFLGPEVRESSFVGDMLNRFRKGGAVAIGRTAQGIARGGYEIERLAGQHAEVKPEFREDYLRSKSDLYRLGDDIVAGANEAFPTDVARDATLPAVLAEGAGGMVPTVATGAGGRLAAAVQYALNAGEQGAQEAIAAGKPEAANRAFVGNAAIGGLTEGVLGVAPRVLPSLRAGARPSVAKAIGKGMVREGAQEGLEQAGQNVVARDVAGYAPDRPILANVPMAIAAGGLLGGGANALGAVLARINHGELPGEPAARQDAAPLAVQAADPESRALADPEPAPEGQGKPVVEIRGDQFAAPTIGLARKMAAEWAHQNLPGAYLNQETAWEIAVSKAGIDKALSGRRDFPKEHLETITVIPQLLGQAHLEETRPDRDANPAIKAIHIFRAPLRVGESQYSVKLTVKEHVDGRRWYDHSLTQWERPAGTSLGDTLSGSAPQGPQTGPGAESSTSGRGTQGATSEGPLADPVSMLPIPPGVPVGGLTRMPVAMDPIVEGRVDMPTQMQALESAVRAWGGWAPIRTGRFGQRARGIYNRQSDIIRLNSADNLPTATHEVGHALAEYIWGDVGRAKFRTLPRQLRQELMQMGRALYGNTKPAGGYLAEGWAEFTRLYLTTEDAPLRAPQVTRWFESQVLPTNKSGAKALERVRGLADTWRGQGARARAEMQMKRGAGALQRLTDEARKLFSKQALLEEGEPLRVLSKTAQQILGRRLSSAEDPYLVYSAKRGTVGAILDRFLYHQPVDIWGRPARGAASLEEALAPVTAGISKTNLPGIRRRMTDFGLYLWTRRAQERWGKGQNPGISLEDATYLRQQLQTPQFELAANAYYRWWDSVLDYFGSARPENAAIVQRIRTGSSDYVPLPRVLDPANSKTSASARLGGGLYRMSGSGLPIRNVWESTLQVAERILARAHRDMVLESVLDLANHKGTGVLVEEVPRSRVEKLVNLGSLRQELEKLGIDTQGIPDDELIRYWTHAAKPTGSDPIIARQVGQETKWYQVPPDVYDLLEGMEPIKINALFDMTLGAASRLLKLGTTGIRPSFALTNLMRDFPTMLAQSVSDRNAVERLGAYLAGWGDVLRTGLAEASGGRVAPSPWVETFQELGVQGAQWLGQDIKRVRRAATSVFAGKVFRRVAHPLETLRELVNAAEMAPRLGEMRMVARDLGWAPGTPLTPEQAITMAIAAKRITTDFSAAGRYGRVANQVIPFFNAALQGSRAFARSFAGDRDVGTIRTPVRAATRAALIGLAYFTLPALVNWWRNKDEDWYHALPWRERFLYTNVLSDTGVLVQVPRSQEWGALFMAMPEALFDAAYRRDPRVVVEAFKHLLEVVSPIGVPDAADVLMAGGTFTVPGQLAKEQLQNRTEFFDRPIVPEGERFLLPGEQRGPYTSWLAKTLGDAFPGAISPRRVDHIVRGLLGGVFSDLAQVPDVADRWRLGQAEASDLPVAGRLFRRGGEYSASNQHLADLFDLRNYWQSRSRSKTQPLSEVDKAWLKALNAQVEEIQEARRIADQTQNPDARRRLYQAMSQRAESLMTAAKRSRRTKF